MEVKSTPILKSSDIKTRAKKKESESLDVSNDGSSCFSDSSSACGKRYLVKKGVGYRSRRRPTVSRSVKVVPEPVKAGIVDAPWLRSSDLPKRRCTWITPYAGIESRASALDPVSVHYHHLEYKQVYISFHDEEWGVPVHDDRKLFELLILSEALAELSWPTILNKRDIFRKLFDNFDPSSVAKFSEKKIISLRSSGSSSLSEQKLRAVVENARQILKVMDEFGSFSGYCWSFVSHKPIVNGFRYARQVPTKTPKAEAMSKDMMQRGFRCVGPTVMYSFMQAAGLVNDHLSGCFRYGDCIHAKEPKTNIEEP